MKINTKILILTFFLAIYMGATAVFYEKTPFLLNFQAVVILFYCILCWKIKSQGKIISPYVIFMVFYVLFNYGQCIMWVFGIHSNDEIGKQELYYRLAPATTSEIQAAQWYICFSMLAIHLGVILSLIFRKHKKQENKAPEDLKKRNIEDKALGAVSQIIFAIVYPLTMALRLKELSISHSGGYKSLYYSDDSTQSGYMQIIMYLLIPSILGILLSQNVEKGRKRIVFILFIIYVFVTMFCGYRGEWLYPAAAVLLVYARRIKIKPKIILIGAIAMCLLVSFTHVITSVRDSGLGSLTIASFSEAFSSDDSPISDAFFEMGGSMGIIIVMMRIGASAYPYANTYLTSILGAISSRFLSFIGIKHVGMGGWLSQEYLRISWGTGFSMLGEAYTNGGGYVGGLIYMILLGFLIGLLFSIDRKKGPIYSMIAAASINAILPLTRGTVYLVLKEILYGPLLLALCIVLYKKYILHRSDKGIKAEKKAIESSSLAISPERRYCTHSDETKRQITENSKDSA